MQHALQRARRGTGFVEPNPLVGAVIVDERRNLIAEGWHQRFGGAHAEVEAISAAGGQTQGHDLFVTLEPCSHHGKTPPCVDAVIAAGFRRVVIGCVDPAEHTSGQGIARLQEADVTTEVGICRPQAEALIAPFTKLMREQRPWVHAKWAMTLDGLIATRTGHSQWISNSDARAEVHRWRGCMDAIITGAGTVRADNPQLTARPAGARIPLRVVLDRTGESVTVDGRLMSTLNEARLLLCVAEKHANTPHMQTLKDRGAEIFVVTESGDSLQVLQVLQELGRRQLTNVLLEAGPGLLGTFFDKGLVDEVHTFIAPKIVGGSRGVSPVGGAGLAKVPAQPSLQGVTIRQFGDNVLMEGRVSR